MHITYRYVQRDSRERELAIGFVEGGKHSVEIRLVDEPLHQLLFCSRRHLEKHFLYQFIIIRLRTALDWEFLMHFRRSFAFVLLVTLFVDHLSAAPAAPFIDPAGLPGPLVIVGEGKVPEDAQKAFFELAGKQKAKIVVITTGDKEADNPKKARTFLKMWEEMKPESVQILHTLDRKQADDPVFVNALTEATGVWFTVTDQAKIVEAYRGTRVEKELKKLH
jgi:hypothetical protein